MKTLVVVDIDGTIADAGRRFKEAGPEPDRSDKSVYDAWVDQVQNAISLLQDKPVSGMSDLVHALHDSRYVEVVFLTSRESRWRDVTNAWILKHGFPFTVGLLMRENGDYTEGVDFKERSIQTMKQAFYCHSVIVIDDDGRGDIREMCKRNGYTFLKALSGGQE